jgi:hypothetical protein
MLHQKIYNKATFRFCQWSRAGYAIFNSLSAVVTIGVLALSVSEKSLLKSNTLTAGFSQNHLSTLLEEECSEDAMFEQIAEITVIEQTSDIAAAAQNNILY